MYSIYLLIVDIGIGVFVLRWWSKSVVYQAYFNKAQELKGHEPTASLKDMFPKFWWWFL